MLTFRDVTERRAAERALEERARELARSNADLEQFAYVASHDLQEPLRAVVSYLQLLERRYGGQLDERAEKYIGLRRGRRAADADADLRPADLLPGRPARRRDGAGRPRSGAGPRRVRACGWRSRRAAPTITHDPLPTVDGDTTQLTQLFQNLLGNAIKFRGEAPPRIHVSAERQDGAWLFSVRDNGIGIAPEYRERVFVLFQRLHGRDEYGGTGIGLAVCKKIVERRGGTLWVDETPGGGSTFWFTIPDAGEATRMSAHGGCVTPIEILLVEDSPSDIDLTREALEDTRVRNNLSVVNDGVEALAFLRREGQYAEAPHPDLILLDLNLPKKDGREVLAEIKADPDLRRIPVVVLTTSGAEQDILESYNLHANCYVQEAGGPGRLHRGRPLDRQLLAGASSSCRPSETRPTCTMSSDQRT